MPDAIEVIPTQTTEEVDERAIELLLSANIEKLSMADRAKYCYFMAKRNGLDPLARPFDIISSGGKTFVYANRSASDQLRKAHRISIEVVERGFLALPGGSESGVYYVRVVASTPDGRHDESVGAINIMGAKGEALANAIMKAETKAKRRATLSIAGLGMLDESEVSSMRGDDEVLPQRLGPKVLTPPTGDFPPTAVPK